MPPRCAEPAVAAGGPGSDLVPAELLAGRSHPLSRRDHLAAGGWSLAQAEHD